MSQVQSVDEARILAVLDSWAKAMRDKDADAIIEHQADSVLAFSLAPPLQVHGNDRDGLAAWLATWDGKLIFELAEIAVHIGGDTAWCTCLTRLGGRKDRDMDGSFWLRQTIGLDRILGDWKIAHTHESVPFSMDGEPLPLFDLQP